MKNIKTSGLLLIVCLMACGTALANAADDAKWIAQCQKDNKDEGQTEAVVTKYCTCMNDKMPESEDRSITEWEKTHKAEEKECSAKAGWKDK